MSIPSGLILIDKPVGCTSHDVVARARRALGTKSVGHAGTLDPIASGLLVLLVGEGTKLSNYVLEGDKGYEVLVRFGIETDTWDKTGQVLKENSCHLLQDELRAAVESLSGEIELPVPVFSAVKVQGQKLYEAARKGIQVQAPLRRMNFYDLKWIDSGPNWVRVQLRCSKGGFIRSWAHELGRRLGVGGVVEELRRTWSDPYSIDSAVSLEVLEQKREIPQGSSVPLYQMLPEWPQMGLDGKDRQLLLNGQISYRFHSRLRPFVARFGEESAAPGIKVVDVADRRLLAVLLYDHEVKDFSIGRVFPQNY